MSEHDTKPKIDELTGTATTGHTWDGMNELNTPVPSWWIWLFYATVVWGVIYMIMYPSLPVPGGSTEGTTGYTQYKELAASQAEIQARKDTYLATFRTADYETILASEELFAFAVAGGQAKFKDNCATCHGSAATGAPGYPNLIDDAWLWGGDINAIEATIRYGIRSTHPDTRLSDMPRFGIDELLEPAEIKAVAQHVLSLSDQAPENVQGAAIYAEQCIACHGEVGTGSADLGAPNLVDAIWLYGATEADVITSISTGRGGVMPAWAPRLDDDTIRQLTIYVHQLGGGKMPQQLRANEQEAVTSAASGQ